MRVLSKIPYLNNVKLIFKNSDSPFCTIFRVFRFCFRYNVFNFGLELFTNLWLVVLLLSLLSGSVFFSVTCTEISLSIAVQFVLLGTGRFKLTDAKSSFSFSFFRSKKMSGSRQNPRKTFGNSGRPYWVDGVTFPPYIWTLIKYTVSANQSARYMKT